MGKQELNRTDFIIREATLEDCEVLLGFEQEVILFERPFDDTLKPEKISYYDIKGLIRSPQACLVVAEVGNEIIACGYARIQNSKPYFKHSVYCYLGFMYVRPDYRGNGVNQIILAHLKKWALDNGVNELQLEVYEQNINAIKAYEKSGFQKSILRMRMEI